MAKGKLSSSPRINYLLGSMGIFSYYDVINHLPRRYDDFSLTKERGLEDKERVVIYIASFDILSDNGTYFKVIAYNRDYLGKIIKLNEYYTVIGSYDKKKNTINMINIMEGKISQNDALRPIYSLPKDLANRDYVRLVNKSLNELEGHIGSIVPFSYQRKYRLVTKGSISVLFEESTH